MEVFGAAMQLCRSSSFQTQRLSFTTCVCMPQQNWRVLVFFMCSSVKIIPVLFCHFQEIQIFLLVAGEVALHFESRASEFPLSTVCIQCSLVCVSISVTFSFFFFIMCFFFFFFYNLFPRIWDFFYLG